MEHVVYVVHYGVSLSQSFDKFICVYSSLPDAINYCVSVLELECADLIASSTCKIRHIERATTNIIALVNMKTNDVVTSFLIHTMYVI